MGVYLFGMWLLGGTGKLEARKEERNRGDDFQFSNNFILNPQTDLREGKEEMSFFPLLSLLLVK